MKVTKERLYRFISETIVKLDREANEAKEKNGANDMTYVFNSGAIAAYKNVLVLVDRPLPVKRKRCS